MNKFHKLKLFGMVAILTVALIFIGINLLDAHVQITGKGKGSKKPKPTKEEATWTVAIPGESSLCNLYGLPELDEDNIYQNKEKPGRVDVTVEKKKGGKSAEYLLRLTIWYSVEEDGTCIPGGPKVGFQNVDLTLSGELEHVVWHEYPCFFPNYLELTGCCYNCIYPETAAQGLVPLSMQHFLNNYPQPFCDTGCGIYSCESRPKNCIYQYVDILITVDYDIEKIEIGELLVQPTGQVWVKVVNNFTLQEGCEDWHNVSGLLKRDNSEGCITVHRDSNDTWKVTIDGVFTFNEIYKGHWHDRWEYKIPYWARTPLKFITKWTRQPVE